MQIFLDTGDIEEIREMAEWGIIDGVTTNPSLIAKTGRKREDVVSEICELINGPISAEVVSTEAEKMIEEGKELAKIHPNIVVKLPLIEGGIKACKALTGLGIKTNVTLCFSPNQAILAAKAGATYVSPFIGRLDDIGQNGMQLIHDLRLIFDTYQFETQILAASIRHSDHFRQCALLGADVATCPSKVVKGLLKHPLTDNGLEQFLADFKSSLS